MKPDLRQILRDRMDVQHKLTIRSGYPWVFCPEHPRAVYGMYQLHRLAWEVHHDKFLRKQQVVHHIDENKMNWYPSNLQVFRDQAAHLAHHRRDCPGNDPKKIRAVLDAAMSGEQTKAEVASSLGVSVGWISGIQKKLGVAWNRRLVTEQQVRKALKKHYGDQKLAEKELGLRPRALYHRFRHLLDSRKSPRYLEHLWPHVRAAIFAGHSNQTIADRVGVSLSAIERRRAKDNDLPSRRGPRPKGASPRNISSFLTTSMLAQAEAQ